jgi:hypothetical protein
LVTDSVRVGAAFSVELWFWNGLSNDVRPVSGYLISRAGVLGDQLAISGAPTTRGRLLFASDLRPDHAIDGKTTITPRSWHHVVFVREPSRVTVYLDGNREPEIRAELAAMADIKASALNVGSGQDGTNSLEGKIDEVAIYSRALAVDEVDSHFRAAVAP